MIDGSVWLTWVALFVGAGIPLDRILPWIATRLSELDSTLEKPRGRTHRIYRPLLAFWIVGLSAAKGYIAWAIATNSTTMSEWGQVATLAIVIIGHSWTIFADNHPSPFWVIFGIFLGMSFPFAITFFILFCVFSLLLNLPHPAIVICTGIVCLNAVNAGTIDPLGLPILTGITLLTVLPQLSRLFDDLPPTLWGLFVKRL